MSPSGAPKARPTSSTSAKPASKSGNAAKKSNSKATNASGAAPEKKRTPKPPPVPPRETYSDEDDDVSSDEEVTKNTTGEVPLEWYSGFDHIGYDRSGQKIEPRGDGDVVSRALLARGDDDASRAFRRTVYDARNDEHIVLTDRELTIARRMVEGRFPRPEVDAEPDYIDYYSGIAMKTSQNASYEPKRRFVPSKWEGMRIHRIARGILEGTIKLNSDEAKQDDKPKVWMLWGEHGETETHDDALRRRKRAGGHVPAPKSRPPGHNESYHPPPEYLLSKEELEELRANAADPDLVFEPKDFGALRAVPAYPNFVRERFERCLDLYLCARTEKVKLNIDPESLVPRLPTARELRPFPTTASVKYLGHDGRVRSVAVDPTGQYVATGGEDGTVRVWELESGRCLGRANIGSMVAKKSEEEEEEAPEQTEQDAINAGVRPLEDAEDGSTTAVVRVAWNPKHPGVIACACGSRVVLIRFGLRSDRVPAPGSNNDRPTKAVKASGEDDDEDEEEKRVVLSDVERCARLLSGELAEEHSEEAESSSVTWTAKGALDLASMLATPLASLESNSLTIQHKDKGAIVVDLKWHAKGEFLAVVSTSTTGKNGEVLIHHVGRRQSQDAGFSRGARGDPQCATFHPVKPIVFVATKTHVLVFHLTKQQVLKKLRTGLKWISSIDVHPSGDHVVLGSYDCRVAWFDLDLGPEKPYKTLRHHAKAVRRVCFHAKFPLMASVADDGAANVFHARVFEDDLTRGPLIVPVKRIAAHDVVGTRGAADAVFHPTQPWLITCGADGLAALFVDLP